MDQWKDIQGYEGLYQISNFGNVKSLARDVEWRGTIRHYPERILKPADDGCGYMFVILCKEDKAKKYKVHRLVASAFIENPDDLPQVNHRDEDKTNNCVENLEWCTNEYNCNYGTRNARVSEAHRGMTKPWVAEAKRGVYNTKCSIPIDMLTKQGDFIRRFPSSMEVERWLRANGNPKAQHAPIIQCCKGKVYKSCYGFKWRYAQVN